MKLNIDLNKIVTGLITVVIVFSAGAVVEMHSLKGEVHKNTQQIAKDDLRINVMSQLMCSQAITNGVANAAELCKEIIKKR